MKPFAEILAADIDAAFLNLGEFADEHDLNGVTCMAVVQNINTNGTLTTPGNIHRDDLIIFGSHVMVNVGRDALCGAPDSEDAEEPPVPGQLFALDGKQYLVEDVSDDLGILTIMLTANDR